MKRWTRTAVAALLVLIGLLAVAIPLTLSRAGAKLQAQYAAVRAAGYPVTLEELNAWYEWPPTVENGAIYAEQGFSLFNMRALTPESAAVAPLVGDARLTRSESLDPEARKVIAALLTDNAAALDLFRKAAQQTRSRYSIDFSATAYSPRDHRAMLDSAGDLLLLEAVLAAEEGSGEKATAAVETALGLSETLADEPDLMAQLSRVRQHSRALDVLNRLLHRTSLGETQLARFDAPLRAVEDRDTFYRGLVGLRCEGNAWYDDSRHLMSMSSARGYAGGLWRGLGMTTLDRLWFLDRAGELVEASRMPLDERPDRVDILRPRVDNPPAYVRVGNQAWLHEGAANLVLTPVGDAASLRCARTALAIERYRLARGALPERLDDLVPQYLDAVPRDPYAKGPLLYRRRDKGYIVYSVGLDRTDSGGIDWSEVKPSGGGVPKADFGFIVER